MSSYDRHRGDGSRLSRSRSPKRLHGYSHRSRSPHRRRHHHHRSKRHEVGDGAPKELPYGARQLVKRDYAVFRPMFALYLDIQKQKVLEDMDEVEAKGRWKSFIGKWNRGELAEGWYDPLTLQKAIASCERQEGDSRDQNFGRQRSGLSSRDPMGQKTPNDEGRDLDSDSDNSIGPTLPGQDSRSRGKRVGPSIPNMQDLELKREMEAEDSLAGRDDIRFARKVDRTEQKEALQELVPRAEAGTRERQLEKKKELNEKMKSFRERSPGAVEVPDSELMGVGDGLSDFKRQRQEFERKKNEREQRKEEILRARAAEREDRLAEYRQKEDKTMAMLKALAKQNFGRHQD